MAWIATACGLAMTKVDVINYGKINRRRRRIGVKEAMVDPCATLTGEGHAAVDSGIQAWTGHRKPNLVKALIQLGA